MKSVTTSYEHIAFDGPIRLSQVVAVGAALLLVCAWFCWRERHVVGAKTAVLFWILRSTVIATVAWMFLAPSSIHTATTTTRKSVAIVVDVSSSMQVVDPPDGANDLRWATDDRDDAARPMIRAFDRAAAAFAAAGQRLSLANDAISSQLSESADIAGANIALHRAREHLREISDEALRVGAGEIDGLSTQLIEEFDEREFLQFSRLCDELERGTLAGSSTLGELIPDLLHRIEGIESRFDELESRILQSAAGESRGVESTGSEQPPTRLTRAAGWLTHLQPEIDVVRERADVYYSTFAEEPEELSGAASLEELSIPAMSEQDGVDPRPSETNLSAALEQLYRHHQSQPLAAAIILTDAGHNVPGERTPPEVAGSLRDVPVYMVPIGSEQHRPDLLVQSVSAPPVAMRNDDIVIEVRVEARRCAGESTIVQLLQDGEVLDFRELKVAADYSMHSLQFERHMPALGEQRFQVAIVPIASEWTPENNHDVVDVQVTRDEIKVLVADEFPRWEYRYLTQLFRRDPQVQLDELLFHPRLVATGQREQSQAFPATIDDWDQYDVVILGDISIDHFPAASQESLIDYIRQRSGTLVLIAGRDAMPHAYADHPLADVLPVEPPYAPGTSNEQGFAMQVTAEGENHRALLIAESEEATRTAWDFINRYSPFYEISDWRRPLAATRTLIAAVPRDRPDAETPPAEDVFLCWHPVGGGRVVYLSAPETYRLRFLRGDRLHYRFWGQLLRWAVADDLSVGTELVRIRTDKSRYETDEHVRFIVNLIDADRQPVSAADDLQVQVSSAEQSHTLAMSASDDVPGEYTGDLRVSLPGIYQASPAGAAVESLPSTEGAERATTSFTVQAPPSRELSDTRSNPALARQIAAASGGLMVPPTAIEEVLELTDLEPVISVRSDRQPLWLNWACLWIVFGGLQMEWIIRKWKGWS